MNRGWVVRAAVVALACAVVGALTSGCDTKSSAARSAARTYLNAVASASKQDLVKLALSTATDNPAAIRTAGDLLAKAHGRITIIDVGSPSSTTAPDDLPDTVTGNTFVDFTRVGVVYRLDGRDYQASIVLAHPKAYSAHDPANWLVVKPLTGSIAWKQPSFGDVVPDVYVGGVRIVRKPVLVGPNDDPVQPLYPAIYQLQSRMDPYYVSPTQSTPVPAMQVTPPELTLSPTQVTRTLLTKQVWARFAGCDTDPIDCPVYGLVGHLNDDIGEHGWWLGLTKKPKLTLGDDGQVTLTAGTLRYRDRQGTHELNFDASGRWGLDSGSLKPSIFEIEAVHG